MATQGMMMRMFKQQRTALLRNCSLMKTTTTAAVSFSTNTTAAKKQTLALKSVKKISLDDPVLYMQDVGTRTIVWNRPKVLNALNLDMIRDVTPKLLKFASNPTINAIFLQGNSEKAFCAGGDIRFLYDNGKDDNKRHLAIDFFREEYRLNYLLATMQKPIISILNGITMGGGVGLSVHGKFVIATEKTTFAMPETAIGFFPDVGASFVLPRIGRKLLERDNYQAIVNSERALLGQGLGTYLALTGERVKGAEVMSLALATHYVELEDIEDMKTHLTGFDFPATMKQETKDSMIDGAIEETEAGDSSPEASQEFLQTVEEIFGAKNKDDTMEGIMKRLQQHNSDWSFKIHDKLLKMSPLSLKVTLKQMREGAKLDCKDCFQMEFRLATRMMENADFFEGVRAVIVDKDHQPKWKHAAIADVATDDVSAFFHPLHDDDELVLYAATDN